MGALKPGVSYIYERANGVTYARENGADPMTRIPIGWDSTNDEVHRFDPRTGDGRPLHEHIQESQLWGEIHREAKTNPTLQKALDRAIMIYKLSKDKL
jgi:hypothetical protein